MGLTSLAIVLSGCGGDSSSSGTTGTGGTDSSGTTSAAGPQASGGAPANAPGTGPMMSGGGMSPGGMMGPGAGSAGAGGGQAQAAAGPPAIKTPPPNRRNDPFAPWWPAPPPPPAITMIDPVRIATLQSYKAPPPEPVQIAEVPNQRVSGILTGNGVYALIDGGGENQYVVKPGDPVGEYRVDRISADSVTLKRTVGTRTYTQVIPLSDAGSAPRMRGPGGVGGYPGGGMRSGMMPGGMMGGGGARGAMGPKIGDE